MCSVTCALGGGGSRRRQDLSADVGSLLSVKADLSEVELSAVSDLDGVRIAAEV